MIGTRQDGSGTVRLPAAELGNGLNDVRPPTSITVRIIDSRLASRSAASARSPIASPQRRPAPPATATTPLSRSGTIGSRRARRSVRLMIRFVAPANPRHAHVLERQADGDVVRSGRARPELGGGAEDLGEPVWKVSAEAGSGDDVGDADANCGEAFLHE